MSSIPKLLTEEEVADVLRCSPSVVTELRETRQLAYVHGTPVLIDEQDLLAYIEKMKVPAVAKVVKPTPPQIPETDTAEYQKRIDEWARAQVAKMRLKRQQREERKKMGGGQSTKPPPRSRAPK